MQFPAFLLNDWLNHYHYSDRPTEYDLASSTGPVWTLRQLIDLLDDEAKQRLLDTRLVYTRAEGTEALREAIAEMEGVSVHEVQVATGAAEGLLILFALAAEPGANVLVPFPGFPPFYEIPRGVGLEVRFYHQRPENQYRVDLDEIKELSDANTKLLVVNTPHNPTGATLSDDEIESLHDFAAERRIQFVVDQVYHPIYHGRKTESASRLPHATVLGDFSKALCLPGIRVGWIVERDRQRRGRYQAARSYFTVSNTSFGEALAVIALQRRETIFAQVRHVTNTNLPLLDKFFSEYSQVLDWVRPQGGMTAFPWLRSGGNARSFCEEAASHGVLLAPGDCWAMPSHFRVGFGASGDLFPQALERLADFVEQYSRQVAKAH